MKEIVAIITSISGERVIVGRGEIEHAMRHFSLPEDIFLELLERILKEPDEDIYMKHPEIFFRPIGNSGTLAVYWYEGPYGNAIEAIHGSGVSWCSPTGELLGVEFDDVGSENDYQSLELANGIIVEVKVLSKKIFVKKYLKSSFKRHKLIRQKHAVN